MGGQELVLGAVQVEVPEFKRVVKFLKHLVSKLRKSLQGVLSEVPQVRTLCLLVMVGICLEAALQVVLRSALEKVGVSLNDMHLLENIAHHLQNVHLIDLIVTVEETFRGTKTGIQATEANSNAHHKDATGVLQEEEGAHPDMNARGVGAGQFLEALDPTVVGVGAIAEALCAVLVPRIGAQCSATD